MGDALQQELADLLLGFFPLFGGVAAGIFSVFGLHLQFDEFRAETLDLLFHDWPDIVGFDHGAEPFGGGDGLQAGDPRPEDKDPCRGDGPGGGHEHREKLGQDLRRDQDGLVAGDGAH